MLLPDPATLQAATIWVALAGAVLGLVSVLVGLYSLVTGRDHWPRPLDWLRRKRPASQEDLRRHGTYLMLNGGAVLLIDIGISMNAFSSLDHGVGEPLNSLRSVLYMIGAATALALVIGAYALSLSVRYTVGRSSADAAPGEPSA